MTQKRSPEQKRAEIAHCEKIGPRKEVIAADEFAHGLVQLVREYLDLPEDVLEFGTDFVWFPSQQEGKQGTFVLRVEGQNNTDGPRQESLEGLFGPGDRVSQTGPLGLLAFLHGWAFSMKLRGDHRRDIDQGDLPWHKRDRPIYPRSQEEKALWQPRVLDKPTE